MKTNRPNILLITSDQQHWNTLSCLGSQVKTPNLDRLASQGVRFDRAYCVNPTCTPTRASIITGLYPSQHGAWTLGTKLPEHVPTVGGYLGDSGYRTALIGKAHFQQLFDAPEWPSLESNPLMQNLEFWSKFTGPFYGFDHVELARNHADEFHVGQHYALWMEEKGCSNWRDYFQKPAGNQDPQKHKWLIPEEYHYDAWIADRTNSMMEQYSKDDESFFLWASFLDPHPPYLVPEPWDTMYDPESIDVPGATPGEHDANPPHLQLTQTQNADFSPWRESGYWMHGFHSHVHDDKKLAKDIAVYYGMISLMDKYIGKILDKLDELGLAENTVVVFSTDHGHFFGQHGLVAKGPFHYEDMIKVPFLVRWPGTAAAGTTSDSLQSLVDLAPTFMRIAGLEVPRTMTGVDQSDVWTGKSESARDHIVVEHHHEPTTIHLKTYVDERYKLTVFYGRECGELFDLLADPGEINNLWNDPESASLKSDLVMKLLFAEMGKEPMWMPRVWGA